MVMEYYYVSVIAIIMRVCGQQYYIIPLTVNCSPEENRSISVPLSLSL